MNPNEFRHAGLVLAGIGTGGAAAVLTIWPGGPVGAEPPIVGGLAVGVGLIGMAAHTVAMATSPAAEGGDSP